MEIGVQHSLAPVLGRYFIAGTGMRSLSGICVCDLFDLWVVWWAWREVWLMGLASLKNASTLSHSGLKSDLICP